MRGGGHTMVISKRERESVLVYDLAGEFTRGEAAAVTLYELVKDELQAGRKHVLIDFTKVEFIDSFGIGEIVASFISAKNAGGTFKLCGLSKRLRLIFQVTGLDTILEIFDDCEESFRS